MSGLERDLQQRLNFEEAYAMNPHKLSDWIETNKHKETWQWQWELYDRLISPLQREINLLRHQPKLAIVTDNHAADDDYEIPF